jgi:hypothetical protein
MKTKKDRAYSFEHTKQRLQERYSMVLSKADYEHLCRCAKLGNGLLEALGEKKQKIVQVELRGRIITVVYGLGCEYVTTVLPPK